jgi:hypothetical protein
MAQPHTILVTCPICRSTLEVKAADGKVVRHFEHKEAPLGSDKLSEALKDAKGSISKTEEKFKASQEKERTKLERLDKTFHEKKDAVKKSGDTGRPIRDIDLD